LSYLLGTSPTGYSTPGGTQAPGSDPTSVITQAYRDYLGRDPEAGITAQWQQMMDSGMSADQIRQAIAASPEAQQPHAAWAGAASPAQAAQAAASTAASSDPAYGSLTRNFSAADLQEDPGIQFATQQGNLSLLNSQAAKNGVLSGGALKDLIAYNSGMAAQGYQSAYDRYMGNNAATYQRLMGMTGVGQAAASGTSSNAASMAGGIASTIQGAGQASASGTVGAANALSGAASTSGNAYFLSSLLKNGGGSGTPGGPITTSANPGGVYIAPEA
jgi:hypothetical protein